MPRSKPRKRKASTKSKKLRLVFKYQPDHGPRYLLPQFTCTEQFWHGVVAPEVNGEVSEFEIRADERLPLSDFLQVLSGELRELVPDDACDCEIRVYLRA